MKKAHHRIMNGEMLFIFFLTFSPVSNRKDKKYQPQKRYVTERKRECLMGGASMINENKIRPNHRI